MSGVNGIRGPSPLAGSVPVMAEGQVQGKKGVTPCGECDQLNGSIICRLVTMGSDARRLAAGLQQMLGVARKA